MNIYTAPLHMRSQAYKYMADRSVPGPILLMSFFLAISFVTPIHLDREFTTLAMFITLMIIIVVRGVIELGINKLYPRFPDLWPKIYSTAISLTAATWGLWCLDIVAYYGIDGVSLMVLVCTAGVSAGGVIAVIPHYRLSLIFQCFVLLPTAIYSFTFATGHAYTISYLFICYLLFMSGMGWKLHGEYWKSAENAHLLNERAKELTVARDTAVKLAQTKSDFLATMSHEIRTPLNGILGMSQLLEESKLDDEQRENVEIILSSTRSLLTIVNDILDFSKFESGSFVAEHKAFSLSDFITQICRSFKNSLSEKQLQLFIDIDPNCPEYIQSDEHRLKQVLVNLIGNAIKFTEHGHIALTVKPVRQTYNNARIRFEVIDTGIGISTKAQPGIFDSFTQEDASTTRKFGGTGLGLAICKKIIDLFGGEIGLSSEQGKGSTFWFELDLDIAFSSEISPNEAHNKIKDLAGIKILLAEDNPVNIRYARTLLEKLGAQVIVAENGQEAVDFSSNSALDIILMDCQMPVLDGYLATKQIRKMERFRQIPIIAVSANSQNEDLQRCLDAGMNDFVVKPFTREMLTDKLEKWLDIEINKVTTQSNRKEKYTRVDMTRLQELKEIMDDEYADLVSTFVSNTETSLNAMREHIRNNNNEGVLSILHSLKSATQNMGTYLLSSYIGNYETGIKNSEIDAIDIDIELLQHELAAVKPVLLA